MKLTERGRKVFSALAWAGVTAVLSVLALNLNPAWGVAVGTAAALFGLICLIEGLAAVLMRRPHLEDGRLRALRAAHEREARRWN
jgi:hypothetical protein